VQLIVNIIVLAAIYALLACGYVLIYRVSRVLNMAHGEIAMLGAYLLYTTASLFVANPFTAIAVAVVMSLTVGVLVYVLLMRKMTGEMVLARPDRADLVGGATAPAASAAFLQSIA
jgi:branched-chain amino acid transport system permease protein